MKIRLIKNLPIIILVGSNSTTIIINLNNLNNFKKWVIPPLIVFSYPIRGRGEPKHVNNKDGGPPPS
jgi:hypothetical protein